MKNVIYLVLLRVFLGLNLLKGDFIEYVICIDGGGSKTKLNIIDYNGNAVSFLHEGTEKYSFKEGSSNINSVGIEVVKETFDNIFDTLFLLSDVSRDQIVICAGVAGAGSGENKEILKTYIKEKGFRAENIYLKSDAQMALDLVGEVGVILISGTGSVCLGKDGDKIYQHGGVGWLFDSGSGFDIGKKAIHRVLAENKEFGMQTSLTNILQEHFKYSIFEVASKATIQEIASLVPKVFNEWELEDIVAGNIMKEVAKALADSLSYVLSKINVNEIKVLLIGGVFQNNLSGELINFIKAELANCNYFPELINFSYENIPELWVRKFLLDEAGA